MTVKHHVRSILLIKVVVFDLKSVENGSFWPENVLKTPCILFKTPLENSFHRKNVKKQILKGKMYVKQRVLFSSFRPFTSCLRAFRKIKSQFII